MVPYVELKFENLIPNELYTVALEFEPLNMLGFENENTKTIPEFTNVTECNIFDFQDLMKIS